MNEDKKNTKEYKDMTPEDFATIGEVKLSDDVVATIAGLAAFEVEGIAAMYGNLTGEIIGRIGMKNLSKGVKVTVTGQEVEVQISVTVRYGYNIPKLCTQVQEKVRTAIENMTGLYVTQVNVRIVGVDIKGAR